MVKKFIIIFVMTACAFLSSGRTVSAADQAPLTVGSSTLFDTLIWYDDFNRVDLNLGAWNAGVINTAGQFYQPGANSASTINLQSLLGANYATLMTNDFVIQFDARLATDRTDLMVGTSVSGHDAETGFALFLRAGGAVSIYGPDTLLITDPGMSLGGEWHNVAIRFNRNTNTLSYYVDQALVGSRNLADVVGANSKFNIATDSGFNPQYIGLSWNNNAAVDVRYDNIQVGIINSSLEKINSNGSGTWSGGTWDADISTATSKQVDVLAGNSITVDTGTPTAAQVSLAGTLTIDSGAALTATNQVVVQAGGELNITGTLNTAAMAATNGIVNLGGTLNTTGPAAALFDQLNVVGSNAKFNQSNSASINNMSTAAGTDLEITGAGWVSVQTLDMQGGGKLLANNTSRFAVGTMNMGADASFQKNNGGTLTITALNMAGDSKFTNTGNGALNISAFSMAGNSRFEQTGDVQFAISTLNHSGTAQLSNNSTKSVLIDTLKMQTSGNNFTKDGTGVVRIANLDLAADNALTVQAGTVAFGANASFANVSSLNLEGGTTIIAGNVALNSGSKGLNHKYFKTSGGNNLNGYIGSYGGNAGDYPLTADGTDVIITPLLTAPEGSPYYAYKDFLTQTSADIANPAAGIRHDNNGTVDFAESWAGFFTPSLSGTYQFWAWNDDNTKIWVDVNHDGIFTSDEVVMNVGVETKLGNQFNLDAGTTYAVQIAFSQGGGAGYYDNQLIDPLGNQATILSGNDLGGVWTTTNDLSVNANLANTMVNVRNNSTLEINAPDGATLKGIDLQNGAALTLTGTTKTISAGMLSSAAGTNGIVNYAGGLLSVANISPGGNGALGTLTVNGDLHFEEGATLYIDLDYFMVSGGADPTYDSLSDLLHVNGNFTVEGDWTLALNYLGDEMLDPSTIFTIMNITNGTGDALPTSITLSGGLINMGMQVGWNGSSLELTGVGSIPEPGTWLLLTLGLFGLGAVCRRKRSSVKA